MLREPNHKTLLIQLDQYLQADLFGLMVGSSCEWNWDRDQGLWSLAFGSEESQRRLDWKRENGFVTLARYPNGVFETTCHHLFFCPDGITEADRKRWGRAARYLGRQEYIMHNPHARHTTWQMLEKGRDEIKRLLDEELDLLLTLPIRWAFGESPNSNGTRVNSSRRS